MLKNRSFLKGLGSGLIAGALLLQLMLIAQEPERENETPIPQPAETVKITAELVKEKANSLNLQVYDKDVRLYKQEELNAAVNKAVEEAKAQAAAVTPPAEPKQVTVYILEGMSAANVTDLLNNSGVITDRRAFEQQLKQNGLTPKIRSGLYTFIQNEKITDIITRITTPPSQ